MGSSRTRRGLIALFMMIVAGGQVNAACSESSVEMRIGTTVLRFNIEIADTDKERALGLMNRKKLAASSAMLFVFDTPRHATFWMKNTLIPLDIIFLDAAGRVKKVHSLAQPLDETTIDGGEDVAYVLEIKGGLAKRLGIDAGSQMRHPVIDQAKAVWACNSE